LKAWLQLAVLAILILFAVSVFVAWQDIRRQQSDLQAKLAGTQQQLQAADAREESRKAELQQQLARIAEQQRAVQNPQQVMQALPGVLPLPKPLMLEQEPATSSTQGAAAAPEPKVELPSEDLKPLYDYALTCKACQAQLSAAQAELQDDKAKIQALGRERDAALRVARGGSVLQRVVRAAKWFVVGAAAGAVAAKLAR